MSINVSQVYVRYPDETDAADLLLNYRERHPEGPTFLVAKTSTPWLTVSAGDNMPAFEIARLLSRALEATAIWYGLAGSILAYRLIRYHLGREEERILEPAELFTKDDPGALPAYRDVEEELYRKLRELGIPAEYIYLFIEEVGMAGGTPEALDAALVREGAVERFRHRVPRRSVDAVRTLFDHVDEEAKRITENVELRGRFDEKRADRLLKTLDSICMRRTVPPGLGIQVIATSPGDPEVARRLAARHSRGQHAFELEAGGA